MTRRARSGRPYDEDAAAEAEAAAAAANIDAATAAAGVAAKSGNGANVRLGANSNATPQQAGIIEQLVNATGRGLHSLTFQLNLSALYGIGGDRRGCANGV
jgi:hypothetical protein